MTTLTSIPSWVENFLKSQSLIDWSLELVMRYRPSPYEEEEEEEEEEEFRKD